MNTVLIEWFLYVLRSKITYAMLALTLLALGVNRMLDFRGKTSGADSIRLILDSPSVRELLARQEAVEERERRNVDQALQAGVNGGRSNAGMVWQDIVLHPERYIPNRLAFIESMQLQPADSVVARFSSCRFLKQSRARCGRQPLYDSYYAKVRITSGPSTGKEGWSCMYEDVALTGPIAP